MPCVVAVSVVVGVAAGQLQFFGPCGIFTLELHSLALHSKLAITTCSTADAFCRPQSCLQINKNNSIVAEFHYSIH